MAIRELRLFLSAIDPATKKRKAVKAWLKLYRFLRERETSAADFIKEFGPLLRTAKGEKKGEQWEQALRRLAEGPLGSEIGPEGLKLLTQEELIECFKAELQQMRSEMLARWVSEGLTLEQAKEALRQITWEVLTQKEDKVE